MTNTWKRIWMEPFTQDNKPLKVSSETYKPTMRWFTFIHAERSDGQMVWVKLFVEEGKFDPSNVSLSIQNALLTLDIVWKDLVLERNNASI